MEFNEKELTILGFALQLVKNNAMEYCQSIYNYFDCNETASVSYVRNSIDEVKFAIEICQLQIQIIEHMPFKNNKKLALKQARKDLKIFKQYLSFLESGEPEIIKTS